METVYKGQSCGKSTINVIDWLLENNPPVGWNPYKNGDIETKKSSGSIGGNRGSDK